MTTVSPRLETTCPALILKANRGVIHHGAVGIARSLGRLGVPVYAVVDDGYTPLATSRYIKKVFVWKNWPGDSAAFLVAIKKIADTIGSKSILFPIDDLSAAFVTENAIALSQWFLAPKLPENLPREFANKANFYDLCTRVGIQTARSIVPRTIDDVRQFLENATFPVVLKAAEQWFLIKGKYSTKIIQDREQLFEFCKNFGEREYSKIILQEYVPGEDWVYHGYCNHEKNLYVSFSGRKLLSFPLGAGATVLGVSAMNSILCRQSEKLLRATAYSGIIDMDWRRDERDGQYKIMDCNPRVGQNFRMFESEAGIDVVRAQHLDLGGHNIDCSPMIGGRLFIVEPFYFSALIHGWRRNASPSDAQRDPPPGKRELAWWCADDPLPALMMCVRLLLGVIGRTLRAPKAPAERGLAKPYRAPTGGLAGSAIPQATLSSDPSINPP